MTIDAFLGTLRSGQPVAFRDVINLVAEYYDYQPTRFHNGVGDDRLTNEPGTNEGSCKIFAFAQRHNLSQAETLALFGEYYQEVLADPEGQGHRNIRNFMRYGWAGIEFEGEALQARG